MLRRVPSIKKIWNYIGWHPTTLLDATIDLIVQLFAPRDKQPAFGIISGAG
ncbi:MAG: hypothetical protein ABSA57_11445 [Candidatus Acidiferrales bacterium]|jgi:hypothetical protein